MHVTYNCEIGSYIATIQGVFIMSLQYVDVNWNDAVKTECSIHFLIRELCMHNYNPIEDIASYVVY